MRRLLNLIAAAALLVLLCTLVLWVTGGEWAGTVQIPRGQAKQTFLASRGGGFYVVTSTVDQAPDGAWVATLRGPGEVYVSAGGRTVAEVEVAQAFMHHPAFGPLQSSHVIGPRVAFTTSSGATAVCAIRSDWIVIPHWMTLVACSVPLAVWVVQTRRRRRDRWRAERGLCLSCGYDLRVSPERCPECGRAGEDRVRSDAASATPR
jgi:hypothetical protein